MFLSKSNYASLCTFLLQLSWGPHSQFFLLADYLLRHTCDCISSYPSLQIIFPAIFVTAFTIFLICRLSLLYTCDHIHNFSHLQIISCTIFVTAFPVIPHLQIISCAIFVTTFALFFICRLSPLYTCDHIRNFSHLQIISALYL